VPTLDPAFLLLTAAGVLALTLHARGSPLSRIFRAGALPLLPSERAPTVATPAISQPTATTASAAAAAAIAAAAALSSEFRDASTL
jgi:hypothetical protein